MHYFAAVLIKDNTDVPAAVEAAMEPYSEYGDGDDTDELGFSIRHWDWWQIGGRYSGRWSEYDPIKDPRNWEPCLLCGGTGLRTDQIAQEFRLKNPEYTCNGCGSPGHQEQGIPTGWTLKFAGQWVHHEGDVIRAKSLLVLPVSPPYALVTPDGWYSRERWDGDDFVPTDNWPRLYLSKLREFQDHWAVIVDYHS